MHTRLTVSSASTPKQARPAASLFLNRSFRPGATAALLSLLTLCAGTDAARAASAVFTSNPTDANWGNGANWSTGAAPGLFNYPAPGPGVGATTNDVATFNSPLAVNPATGTGTIGGADNPILIDTFVYTDTNTGVSNTYSRNIGSIVFDTANVGSYVIGTSSGPILNLDTVASGANTVTINAAVTAAQLIAAPINFRQPSSQSNPYSFINNSTTNTATLSFTGPLTLGGTTRGYTFTLSGSNTGANIISGNINYTTTTASGFTPFIKSGTGTWILSGTNTFTNNNGGSAAANNIFTGTVATAGFMINGGTLVLENNQALGTNATASAIKVFVNNTGRLQLANNPTTGSLTLDNGLLLTLNNGGTLNANGSQVVNSGIAVSTAAASNVTISTTNASDVFTLGNANNDLTGGAADSVINIGGPGMVLLTQASNYVGGFSINAGTLRMGNATAFGTTAKPFSFGTGSTGLLQLFGNNLTVSSLNSNAANPGTPIVGNGAAGTVTLTVNGATASNYAGVLRDGAAGILALTKSGTGTLTLSGASTYTGGTTVGGGTLFANSATGSATGSGSVNITSGGVLGGNGMISGAVTVAGRVTPGATGVSSVGNLTVGALTLSAGSILDYDITDTATLDQITVTGSGGLTINGGQLNINGAAAPFTTNGVYNLIGYNGAIGGTGVSALTLNGSNQDQANKTYTFGLSGSFVTLTIANNAIPADYYVPNADGAYSNAANWSAGVPNGVGVFAALGGNNSQALTANRTVTVDGAYTVGTLSFNSTSGFGYTLANGGAGTGLTLNNNATGAFVTDSAGSHAISAPLTLTANGATFSVSAAADTLTVSGVVSSDNAANIGLTKAGNGTLALTGVNTYFGGTGLTGGTLQISSAASLGDVSGNLVFGGGTLQLLADATTARNYQVSGSNNAVIDTNGRNLALGGTLTPVGTATGGVIKNGQGTLTFGGVNTYIGATTINAGTLSVATDAGLGAAPTAVATNITIGAGVLQATAGFTLNANRSIVLTSPTSAIDLQNNALVPYAGNISGAGTLNLTGNGTLGISTGQSFTGNTVITGANLQFNPGAGLPGTILLNQGGTFTMQGTGTTSVFPGNTINVAAGVTATFASNVLGNASGSLINSGDANSVLNIAGPLSLGSSNVKQFTTGFTGTVRLNPNAQLRFSGTLTGVGDGGDTATFDLGTGSAIFTRSAGFVSLGALTGTGSLFGATTAGNITTFVVGTKNLSTTFAGTVNNNNNLTVTGTGTLTLTGANTHTGVTTINSGSTLQIDNGGTTGTLGTGGVTNNGTFLYNRSDATTVANTFSGNGTLTTLGGTTTLSGVAAQGAVNPRFGTLIIDPAVAGNAVNTLNSNVAPTAGDNATLIVQNNGSYNVNSSNLIVGGLGTGTLTVTGSTMAGNGATGGVVSLISGLTIGNGASAVGTFNLSAGGTLITPLINSNGGTSTLNLNGGNLVASGASGIFLSGLTRVNVQAGGAIIDDGGSTITIAQVLSHDPALGATADGGFAKNGSGILTMSAANTYTGATTINAGTLTIATNGGLARGDVTIASAATLSLATGVTFAHNGSTSTTLTLQNTDSILNLAAANAGDVQDVVNTLVVNGVTYTTPGYYGSSTSGVAPAFVISQFTGNGVLGLRVMAPVPEPSTWAVMLVGLGGLLFSVRRARRA